MTGNSSGTPTADVTHSFDFILNGIRVEVAGVKATTTLLHWLRATGRTGSKCGCDEGDCGACMVALLERDGQGRSTYRAINSCITFLPMLAGRELVTVEGIATADKLHPVQTCMVEYHGSQCGYCTPGFVVSMFEGYYRANVRTPCQINDQLCGNLCRCTGYRPIRDAAVAAFRQRDQSREAGEEDRFAARLKEALLPPSALHYAGDGEMFHRPGSLGELLALKAALPDAQFVAGATEIGVERNKKSKKFPALISVEAVPELTTITSTAEEWRIGAAVTLTAVEEALAGEYLSMTKMIALFAARQIRNRATLGGNLATASPIGDSAPVLMTLGASVKLASAGGERTLLLDEFFTGYRQTQLRTDEVLKEVVVPRGVPEEGLKRRVDFMKASHRRELDISIVAAAFSVDCDGQGIVRRARIAYGGVAEMPMRARLAEQALEGSTVSAAAEKVAAVLRAEFSPIDDVRGSAEYRRGVVVGLWERFISGETSEASEPEPGFVPAKRWPVSDASRHLRHESAIGHVTGRAQYVDDIAARRPMLEVWPVCSPHARARIVRRDTTKARTLPGVTAVLMAEDIPGHNNIGVSRHDETLFAQHEVCYHGHIVAVVVAETVAVAREAAGVVEVDYEPMVPVVSLANARALESYHTEPRILQRGDCDASLKKAKRVLAGEFSFGGQEHFYLETQAAWAEAGDDGDVTIMSSTQHPSEIQSIVSEVLDLPRHKIVVQAPRMGGGFGGKETQGNTPAAIVALAAIKTGRPVRVQFDRDVDMVLTGKRHPFFAKFEIGFDDAGHLLAVKVELISDGGWSLDLSQPVLDRALFHLDNAYYIPAVYFTGRVAKTNIASNTAFRGFGGPQGMLVIEEIVDRVARSLGLPPEVVRERNLYHGSGPTNSTHYGEEIGDNRLHRIWQMALSNSGYARRREAVDAWNAKHAGVKRGLAITPVKFGISFTLKHYNQAGSLVHLYQDGTVQVNHGGTEMGQGLHTKVLGVAMRELGLPAESIRIMRTSTDKVPNTSATAASSGSDLNGAAVAAACTTLRERLTPVAAKLLERETAASRAGAALRRDGSAAVVGEPSSLDRGVNPLPRPGEIVFENGKVFERGRPDVSVTFAALCQEAYVERISLSATGYFKTPGIHWDWAEGKGRPFAYFACGAAVSEVEVDGYTGMSRVLRVDIVHDVGDSLNPGVDRGQIEGGFVQGMGWLTSEELKWDSQGRLQTHSASTYHIPAISDAPVEFNVTLLPDAAQPGSIHGSKAVGEPPLMLAISVREAIRDAVAAVGRPGGHVALASPATGEAVFLAMAARRGS